jgi:hypothetical protein
MAIAQTPVAIARTPPAGVAASIGLAFGSLLACMAALTLGSLTFAAYISWLSLRVTPLLLSR